jgi:hypothetical protein
MQSTTQLSVNGKSVPVPSLLLDNRTVIVTGKWLRSALIHDEDFQPQAALDDPAAFIASLKEARFKADIFTFSQKFTDTTPKFPYPFVMENVAAISTTNYSAWWEGLPQETRKNVRRAAKRGVITRSVEFDDHLVRGIKEIYDEMPVRQGRKFWHYGKDLETVKRENSTYLETSQFVGAFCGDELIGFLKMVYVADAARIMQILSKNAHFDKRPANALLTTAVEICSRRGIKHFIYGKYIYDNKKNSPVTEFKRRHGFTELSFPKYYVPLTAKGALMVRSKLHLGVRRLLPENMVTYLLNLRSRFYQRNLTKETSTPAAGNIPA